MLPGHFWDASGTPPGCYAWTVSKSVLLEVNRGPVLRPPNFGRPMAVQKCAHWLSARTRGVVTLWINKPVVAEEKGHTKDQSTASNAGSDGKDRSTASNAGSDGSIRVYIGCGHPIQTWARGHRVNQGPIQTQWQNTQATEFESINNNSLNGPVPESQLFWQ
ncbi:hypothetical protein PCASD_24497 [Puccinia coronata f. sp. avenae]|nr:hypothetical protein PCASD_24497 [Puccinia coronata f. sp. avenae]